ncbi:MAG: hypothetical protein AAGN82_11925 [Myxococcota bacterium]
MRFAVLAIALVLTGCSRSNQDDVVRGTDPPARGWSNNAPTLVTKVVDRSSAQLLEVKQGELQTWVRIPAIGAKVGDYVLLGQGTAERDVDIPELGLKVPELVDIAHARAVDLETARRAAASSLPEGAISVATVFTELDQRDGQEIVVYGTVTRVAGAVGWHWVHLSDASGSAATRDYDLTVQTKEGAVKGVRVAYKGRLRKDADLGFGYHYDALLEEATFVE